MSINSEISDFLNPILRTFSDSLQIRIQGYLATAYLRGSAQMIEWGRTKTTDKPIYFEGPPMKQAMDYASKHTATLIKGLDEETADRMRSVISNAIKEKRGIDGLARDIRKQFDDMSKVRSQTISRTETADALEQSFMDRSKDMGVTGKEWIVTDPCTEICEQNDGVIIPIDGTFPSGHDRPPAHPNCRCALAPVMLER